jgi:hypothetical protein
MSDKITDGAKVHRWINRPDESIYTRNKKIKSLEGISEVDFERSELAFKVQAQFVLKSN